MIDFDETAYVIYKFIYYTAGMLYHRCMFKATEMAYMYMCTRNSPAGKICLHINNALPC